jgi:GNAT superfamily N-acetyltransferase
MKIEPATLADIPRLCELLALLFTQEVEFAPDTSRQAEGLRRILSSPAVGAILAARDGADIVGMVNVLFTVSTALGTPVALLEDVIVDPAQRGRGLGGQLVDAAIAFARAAGCGRITLQTDADNVDAHRFYRRHGFEASTMLTMRRMLQAGDQDRGRVEHVQARAMPATKR